MDGKYDDIIGLEYPIPSARKRMSRMDRAAQFAPFAALTGHGAAVKETGRITDTKLLLDEDEIYLLDNKLRFLLGVGRGISATFTYFVPDRRKKGGAYIDAVGVVEKIDGQRRTIILEDRTRIPIDDICGIEFDCADI